MDTSSTYRVSRNSRQQQAGPAHKKRLTVGSLAVAGALVLATASSAQAATYWYANGTTASENQTVTSPLLSNVSGGTGTPNFSSDGVTLRIYMETYRPAPGYASYGFATGDGGVTFHHDPVSSVYQYCFWYFPFNSVSGTTKLDCGAYT